MNFEFTSDIKSIFEKDLVITVMKRCSAPLINMIQSGNNLINTIQLAFADPEQLGKYLSLYKGCLHYILQGPVQIREYIAFSAEFISFINAFISEIGQKTRKQVVAFNHLFCSFLELTEFSFIQKINNPLPYLLPFISDSCIGFVVTKILLSFETIPPEYIETFLQFFPKEDYAIYWFRSALHEKKSLVSLDDAPRVAENLLSLAAAKEKSIFKIQCYEICYILKTFSMTNQLMEVFAKYKENHDVTCHFAIKIFNDISIDILLKAFELPENSFLNNAVVSNFRALPKAEQCKMAETYDLSDKIISLYQSYSRSAVVFDLGLCLKALGSASPNLSSPAWAYLCRSVLSIKHLTSMNSYGGPLPSPVAMGESSSPIIGSPAISGLTVQQQPYSPLVGSPIFVASDPPSILYQ
ncbi:hypothetical protein TVAG_077210 [Trichomonas vaginalis G3]|uniref:Uncharacterized protein n=1 Tax=Trichomonas vaginalis (strain ATCC PRA-98 / G3) TaxID=412133 RepID=A2D9W8_TRIV3|nr:hypothetical protein TVAGG3_0291100 [Trichomonas vaginalis G3]EAY22974.1 hypothetical protein TVAG_077210 [Trichomonas vaginalis G3]KAI5527274.1 hypothetical protein TVAGG3_0291100 [Trichomonas vaginalis G3]|eukprot:XP_001583960.1 hypothetical protein [Trichomonas vaginalis G3]